MRPEQLDLMAAPTPAPKAPGRPRHVVTAPDGWCPHNYWERDRACYVALSDEDVETLRAAAARLLPWEPVASDGSVAVRRDPSSGRAILSAVLGDRNPPRRWLAAVPMLRAYGGRTVAHDVDDDPRTAADAWLAEVTR